MFKDTYLGIRREKKGTRAEGVPVQVQHILLKGTCKKQPVSWRTALKSELCRAAVERMGLPSVPTTLRVPGIHWHCEGFLCTRAAAPTQPCTAAMHCWQQTKQHMQKTWPLQKKSSDAFLTGSATESFICAHTKHAGDLVRLKFC